MSIPAKMNVPDEFRQLLLEFTVTYLLEQPSDLIDFAIEYFTRLRKTSVEICRASEESMSIEDEDDLRTRYSARRGSVFAEVYNPEEDDEETVKAPQYPKTDEQRRKLNENIKNILLFRSMDTEHIREVIDAMFEKKVYRGECIIKQGDDGDNFYVVDTGVYQAFIKDGNVDKLMQTYDNKGSFGELALMYNVPRAATIKATTDGNLWALDRQTFRRIVLKNAFRKRKMYESLLENVTMLSTLEPYERMNLADALVSRNYMDGECIIQQGDVADGMFFIEDGIVRINVWNEKHEEVEIQRLKKGDYFGEVALVTHKPRAASAYAVGQVKVAFLDVQAFERLLGPCMEIMKRNFENYENQLNAIFGSKFNISDIR